MSETKSNTGDPLFDELKDEENGGPVDAALYWAIDKMGELYSAEEIASCPEELQEALLEDFLQEDDADENELEGEE